MKYLILLWLLFLVGCSSAPKKSVQKPIKKAPMMYDALCYSRTDNKYSLIEKLTVLKVNPNGIVVRTNTKSAEETTVKKSCIMERRNIKYKLKGTERKLNFFCVVDYIGDTVFKGEGYLLMKDFHDGEYVIVYNPEKQHEYLLNTEHCQVMGNR